MQDQGLLFRWLAADGEAPQLDLRTIQDVRDLALAVLGGDGRDRRLLCRGCSGRLPPVHVDGARRREMAARPAVGRRDAALGRLHAAVVDERGDDPRHPGGKAGRPAVIVHACRQLGDIIGWRIGLYADNLAKVINGVPAITSTTADAKKEQPTSSMTDLNEHGNHSFDRTNVDADATHYRGRLTDKGITLLK